MFFGALPMIFAGLRIALAVSFIVLVAAEFVATKAGIGYLIWNSWELLQVDVMFVGIVTVGLLGLITIGAVPGDRAQGHSVEGGVTLFSLSPLRGEGRGEGADVPTRLRKLRIRPLHPPRFKRDDRPLPARGGGIFHISSTRRSLLQPAQQIITLVLEACSSSLRTESRCSGMPEITLVSQAPQMPSSQE